jgi:hypothetical protein
MASRGTDGPASIRSLAGRSVWNSRPFVGNHCDRNLTAWARGRTENENVTALLQLAPFPAAILAQMLFWNHGVGPRILQPVDYLPP